jgi:hypothetical protein
MLITIMIDTQAFLMKYLYEHQTKALVSRLCKITNPILVVTFERISGG